MSDSFAIQLHGVKCDVSLSLGAVRTLSSKAVVLP